jgi:hypothetical protein
MKKCIFLARFQKTELTPEQLYEQMTKGGNYRYKTHSRVQYEHRNGNVYQTFMRGFGFAVEC